MPLPDYQTFMLPLLKFARYGKEHTLREAIEKLSDEFGLTQEERTELIPSGRKPRVDDRIGWAATYLRKAQLLSSPARGRFQITQRGLDVLKKAPPKINVHFLEQFAEFVEFRTRREKGNIQTPKIGDEQTPDEVIDAAYQTLRQELAA